MKSAYCIAITACLTVIWLYEEKKKRGMAGNLCWKAAVGYLITRFVFFAISVSSLQKLLLAGYPETVGYLCFSYSARIFGSLYKKKQVFCINA